MEEEKKHYAGFGYRFVAFCIDRVIVGVVGYGLGFVLGFLYASITSGSHVTGLLGNSLSVILMWLYYAGFESSRHQATLGKRIVGVRVTDTVGNRISFGTATVRHFAKILSWLTLGIGFLMILWTKRRQGLHDKIAGTVVVKKH